MQAYNSFLFTVEERGKWDEYVKTFVTTASGRVTRLVTCFPRPCESQLL